MTVEMAMMAAQAALGELSGAVVRSHAEDSDGGRNMTRIERDALLQRVELLKGQIAQIEGAVLNDGGKHGRS